MDRRKFIKGAAGGAGLAGVSAASLAGCASSGASAPAAGAAQEGGGRDGRPNLVFLMGDQLRTMSCGYAGDRYGGTYAGEPAPYTPNIDRLASESADFRNAISGYPVCAPHRASLLTGKHPSSTGIVINETRAMPDPDAIAHVLSEQGYRTGFVGKWHLYGTGHTDCHQFVPPGPYRMGFDDYWAGYNYGHQYYNGLYFRDTFDKIEIDGFKPDTFTDLGIDFMRRAGQDDRPFALFLYLGPPHDPFTWENTPDSFTHLFKGKKFPDPPNFTTEDAHALYWVPSRMDHEWWMENWYPKRFKYRAAYAALTSALDWQVGRVMNALDDFGLADDTVLAFNSDHGEMFGSHGRIAKKIFYEEAARVPFLVRWPGEIEPKVTQTSFDVVDTAPTLLGLMDLPVPESMEGWDLSHVARGEGGDRREAVLMQGMGHTFRWRDGDEWRAVRDERYTYAKHLDGPEYLFDNIDDPYQQNNLINDPDHRGTRRRLKNYMRKRMNELNDPFKPTTWYRDHWTEDRVVVRSATRELEPKYRPENIDTQC
jgi:arylsulfatase A-like enzyme